MRYVLNGFLIAALCWSGGCPPKQPAGLENVTLAMIIIGPTTISAAAGPTAYTVVIGSGGKPANVGFNPPAPLYLQESDGTLMTYTQTVNLPPGVNSQTIQLKLTCTGGRVGGDATTLPAGTSNTPLSSAGSTGRPAIVAVNFLGKRYDGSRGDAPGSTVTITCVP
jgi:hypothetical protein